MSAEIKDRMAEVETPLAVIDYVELDLRPSGAIANALNEQLIVEAGYDELELSDIIGPQPANITPHMEAWYMSHIDSRRRQALQAVTQMCRERCKLGEGEGFFLPVRLGALNEELLQGKRRCYQNHRDRHQVASQRVAALEAEIADAQRHYGNRRAQLGREAHVTRNPLYLGVLIFVLFASEAALNLESFGALPWSTPAIAWGATIITGIAIGFAAHLHGTFLKQFDFYFNAAESDNRRLPAWRMLGIGVTLLSCALWFVFYARSAYLASYTASQEGFGQQGVTPSFLWIVGGSLLGNLLVYLTGAVWAYLMHDRDPEFSRWKITLDRKQTLLAALKLRMEAARAREIEQLNARHQQRVEEARQAFKQLSSQRALARPLELFTQLQARDSLVVGMLQNYRQSLIQRMGSRAKDVRFQAHVDDPYTLTKKVASGEFLRHPVSLKYLEEA
jgi:hypothetical protein